MPITRRKFLKHLAFAVSAGAIAPAALATTGQCVTYDVMRPMDPNGIKGDSPLPLDEGRLDIDQLQVYEDTIIIDQRRKPRKNPLFRGEIGVYDDCFIHQLKKNVA